MSLVDGQTVYCERCGAVLPAHAPGCPVGAGGSEEAGAEQTLLAFGPLGYEHCFGRPGLFVWMQKNNTEFYVTSRRICGLRWGKVVFEIPLGSVGNLQVFPYMLGRVLWVQYWDGSAWKELSVLGSALCHAQIDCAFELLQGRVRPPAASAGREPTSS